mmetsp:Transcript_13028/g.37872  ORF Transcript_13028/g.37872 Transcript_13028/m.37872 type:complete len:298 (-) Transcript_13028:210-1103(-)
MTRPEITLHEMQVVEVLGTGRFGRVNRIAWVDQVGNTEFFALKILERSRFSSPSDGRRIANERVMLAALSHTFILKLVNTYKTPSRLFLLTGYAAGHSLMKRIRRHGIEDPAAPVFYAANLILALKYMHAQGIVHRDIKPGNCVLDERGYIKICDFAFARPLSRGERTLTLAGSYAYLSPEQARGDPYDFSVDLWSLGVTVYEMVYGVTPFEATSSDKAVFKKVTMENILRKELTFLDSRKSLPMAGKLLIKGLLSRDPKLRPGCDMQYEDLMNRQWFTGMEWKLLEQRLLTAPWTP